MQCPACQYVESRVVDSREAENSVRRRRECLGCGLRFTTFERVEHRLPMVVKKDARREPFDRQKLLAGVRLACRKRPVAEEEIDRLVGRVERALARRVEREVASTEIGLLTLGELRGLDPVACVRFASVYEAFQTPEDFLRVLEPLLKGGAAPGAGDGGG